VVSEKLTLQEVAELYGAVPLKFAGYYKYVFDFVGTADDGTQVHASFGGDSADIYRFSISASEPLFLGKNPEHLWNWVWLETEGQTLFEWYD
jgi:hypothetical protein